MRDGALLVAYVSLAIAAFLAGRMLGHGPKGPVPQEAPKQQEAPQPPPAPAQALAQGPAQAQPQKPPADPNQVWRIRVEANDPARGPADAPVTIVVFSSFLCPECAQMAGHLDRIVSEFGKDVRVVFKHKLFPNYLHAMEAAQAAVEAQVQGKFWEFHDRAHKKGMALDRASIEEIAREIGMDVGKLRAALADERHRDRVLQDSLLAHETAAHSMPNVAVNGVRLFGEKTYENLKALVTRRLAEAKSAIAAGTPASKLYASIVENGKSFSSLDPETYPFSSDQNMSKGPENARIQLVVFEDFQCPYCAKVNPSIEAFRKRFPNDVRVVFKNLPLSSLHPNAALAAEAAVEAARQGRFWAMYDLMFGDQKGLDRAGLEEKARKASLDMTAFTAALDRHTHKEAVDRDVGEAERAKVTGTPAIFMNGRRFQGPPGNPEEGFEAVARVYFGLK